MKKSLQREVAIPIVTWAILIALYYCTVKYALPFLFPFLLAFVIAGVLQKPIRFFARKTKTSKKLWAIILSLLFFLTIGAGVAYLAYYIGNTVYNIILGIPDFVTSVSEELSSATEGRFSRIIAFLPDQWEAEIIVFAEKLSDDFFGGLQEILVSSFSQLASMLSNIGIGEAAVNMPVKIASVIVGIVMTVIGTFFLAIDFEGFKQTILKLFPPKYRETAVKIKNTVFTTILKMVKTYATLMLITFVELLIGFTILRFAGMRIPYIPIIAAATAVVDILPILGVGTVLIPWAVISMLLGRWVPAIMILILYAIIWTARNFIEPKIVGDSFGVHPIFMLLAIYTGGKLLGILGIFLLPLTIVIIKKLSDAQLVSFIDEIKTINKKSREEKQMSENIRQ